MTVKHDGWGRYLLPDPGTGQTHPWTRATTWASAIADTHGLTKWRMRMVAKGVASRRDLLALAASLSLEDKKQFDDLAEQALEAAGGSGGRNLGTALHAFTAQVDRGEAPEIPPPWDADIDAYLATLHAVGISILPRYIERVVVNQALQVAGTLDRIVSYDGRNYIADVKTGADLSYAWGEIAVQLALYANADALWNDRDAYEPFPTLNRERAIVMHLPVGQARCDLYWVDIVAGWQTAQLCGDVRAWRTRKDLATPFDRLAEQLEQSLSSPAAEDGASSSTETESGRMAAHEDAGPVVSSLPLAGVSDV